jgi:ParB family chromosome partitioning protein
MVASKALSAGHARTLLGVKNKADMILLAERTVNFDLSVRQLEEEVKKANKPKKEKDNEDIILPTVDYYREMAVKVQSHLGRKVEINGKGRKKSITLFYEDNEDLDDILTLLCGKEFLEEV